MSGIVIFALMIVFVAVGVGGAAYAVVGAGDNSKKRVASLAGKRAANVRSPSDAGQQRRRNIQSMLKDLEKQQAANRQRPSLRRRLEQAGLSITPRSFWILSATVALVAMAGAMLAGQPVLIAAGAGVVAGIGLPRWVLIFLCGRRRKKFTSEFANAIDLIVRGVKSGLPTTEALKIVSREAAAPVGPEFLTLCEGLKVGVSLEQGLKRMYERMPTPEVSFFAIAMTIQQKSGGNLSEALGNLANVLRDRKRLQGKIKAMSSEAKASAMIIGSLPPMVMAMVYMSTPAYIDSLFTERLGNLMLAGCVLWMALGILVMAKMISFKH